VTDRRTEFSSLYRVCITCSAVKRNRQDLIELFKITKGLSRVRIDELLTTDESIKGTRGYCLKPKKTRCNRDVTKPSIFSNKVGNR